MASKVTFREELLYPSAYLAAFDLAGKDVTFTIIKIEKQELQLRNGGKKVKPVLTFKETEKLVVLNVTNAESIASMYGNKADAWLGRQVTFFPTQVPVGRKMEDCIRVREKIPGGAPPPPDEPAKPAEIHPGWFEKLKKIKKVESVPKIFADFIKAHADIDLQKVFGDACDQRHAELKAEQAMPQPEPKGELQ